MYGFNSVIEMIFYYLFAGNPSVMVAVSTAGTFFVILGMILLLFFVAMLYFFPHYVLMRIGRKAGLTDNWMAYVPIAVDIYRLKIVSAPIWYLFFFGFTGLLTVSILEVLLALIFINSSTAVFGLVLMGLITLGHFALSILVNFKYYRMLYPKFNYSKSLSMITLVPGHQAVVFIISILIAFQKNNRAQVATPGGVTPVGGVSAGGMQGGMIIGQSGSRAGASIPVRDGESIVLGRDPSACQLVFPDSDALISKRHCVIRFNAQAGVYTVTDVSTNGTYKINGERLQSNVPVMIARGTTIYLADKKNQFRLS